MQYVTIKDIARALNVSVATVSRAFNDKYDVKKETREMILQKARELGYKPNPIARKLLQKHSYNIGVIVPEFVNSFFPTVIIGIQQVLLEKNYQVIIMQSNECADIELKNMISLENNMVDGLLISLSRETQHSEYLEQLISEKFPVVLFNRVSDELPASKVVFNDYKWAVFATEHLIEEGYRDIVHLCGPRNLLLIQDRIRGFKKAMEKHGLPSGDSQVVEAGIFIEDGERAMEQLIKAGRVPEAIFATNDPTAIGAMKVLKKHGYKIPQDIGVVGFSNTQMAEIVEPALTSVGQPTMEMGRIAAELLLEQITAASPPDPRTIVLDGQLMIRDSSIKESRKQDADISHR
jgi:LacI family transcriptional regulator